MRGSKERSATRSREARTIDQRFEPAQWRRVLAGRKVPVCLGIEQARLDGYEVAADGSLRNGSVFLSAEGEKAKGGPDGLKMDRAGNLYSSGPGSVWIISPQGKHLVTIPVPEVVGNLTWGDKDGKTLYIAASTSIYRIRLNIEGIPQ
jgi:sugar lactone lactonase YvrE